MMGIVLPETCWACNKICNKYNLLHLVGILFPHNSYTVKNTLLYRTHTAYIPWDKTCSPTEGNAGTIIHLSRPWERHFHPTKSRHPPTHPVAFGLRRGGFLLKSINHIELYLKSDDNNRHFRWRPSYIYDCISLFMRGVREQETLITT